LDGSSASVRSRSTIVDGVPSSGLPMPKSTMSTPWAAASAFHWSTTSKT